MTTQEEDIEIFGPVDFVLIEFQGDRISGETGQAVLDLLDAGIVHLWDAVIVVKDADGSVKGVEIADLPPELTGGFSVLAGARSGLVGDDDIVEAGQALDPGTVAVLLVFENSWAVPFITAARRNGGQVVATARIPSDVVIEVLNALDED